MKSKSIKLNTILYGLKTVMSLVFLLITFPYVSRILGADGVGKVTFANSIVSYFVLAAGLGVTAYAIREGSKYRQSRKDFEEFAGEVFTINIISTLVSCVAFVITVFFFENLAEYKYILLILGLSIPLTTIGVEWVFSIYEDYLYITIRSFVIQIFSVLLLLVLVRTKEDVYGYTIFYLVSTVASNIFNYIYASKYCKLRLIFSKQCMKHLKPILIIFASSVASTIYVSTDITILGLFGNDTVVGYYTASTKVYTMIKTALDAVISVSFARLAFYIGTNEKDKFDELFSKLFRLLVLIIMPIMVGVFCLSEEAILLLSGEEYLPGCRSLQILCFALPFTTIGSMFARTLLLPYKHEKDILIATIVGAVINFVLNLIVIPVLFQNGAALTTVFSEMLVLCVHIFNLRKFYKVQNWFKNLVQATIGVVPILLICYLSKMYIVNIIIRLVVAVPLSAALYGIVLVVLRNDLCLYFISSFWSKIKGVKKSGT